MKHRFLTAATLALSALATPAPAQDSGKPTVVTIEAGRQGPKIDRNIFGQFAEHLGTGIYGGVWVGPDSPIPNVRGIRSDVVAALKAIKVPDVRWPGGCFADEYHWRDGVGPKRRSTVNANWGGAIEPDTFGTTVSVLSPLGVRVLGARVGNIVEWPMVCGPGRLRIQRVLYQPGPTRDFNAQA